MDTTLHKHCLISGKLLVEGELCGVFILKNNIAYKNIPTYVSLNLPIIGNFNNKKLLESSFPLQENTVIIKFLNEKLSKEERDYTPLSESSSFDSLFKIIENYNIPYAIVSIDTYKNLKSLLSPSEIDSFINDFFNFKKYVKKSQELSNRLSEKIEKGILTPLETLIINSLMELSPESHTDSPSITLMTSRLNSFISLDVLEAATLNQNKDVDILDFFSFCKVFLSLGKHFEKSDLPVINSNTSPDIALKFHDLLTKNLKK